LKKLFYKSLFKSEIMYRKGERRKKYFDSFPGGCYCQFGCEIFNN